MAPRRPPPRPAVRRPALARRRPVSAHDEDEIEHKYDRGLEGPPEWFLRFGRIDTGDSQIRMDAEFVREVLDGKTSERGMSCYFCAKVGANYYLDPPQARSARYHLGASYWRDMLEIFLPAIANDHVYVFHADLVRAPAYQPDGEEFVWHGYERGSDGEPLVDPDSLRDVVRLTTQEVLDHVYYGPDRGPHAVPLGDDRVGHGRATAREVVWDHYDPIQDPTYDPSQEDAPAAFRRPLVKTVARRGPVRLAPVRLVPARLTPRRRR